MKKLTFLILILLVGKASFAQSSICDIIAGCSDSPLEFPNTVEIASAEPGPNYGCLGSQPNPAWYFLGFDEEGDLDIEIKQVDDSGIPIDVDFICYGPFDDPFVACNNLSILDASKTVDCSYSPDAIEILNLNDVELGEFYILLITNFANISGNITMTQTNSADADAGSTDCSYACSVDLRMDKTLCFDTNYQIISALGNHSISDTAAYQWFKKNGSGIYEEISGETNSFLNITSPSIIGSDMYKLEMTADLCEEVAIDEILINYVSVFDNFKLNNISNISNCGSNNNGIETFDLTVNENEIANLENAADYTFSYFKNIGLTEEIFNITNYTNTTPYTETIYVSISHKSFIGCNNNIQFILQAIENPTATQLEDWIVCDDISNDGFNTFDLESIKGAILNGQDESLFGITFHSTQDDADNQANSISLLYENQIANTEEELFIRIENTDKPICYDTSSFKINVKVLPIAYPVLDWNICVDENSNGFNEFDFTTLYDTILNGQDSNNNSITFYRSLVNAENKTLPLDLLYTNREAYTEEEIFVRVENEDWNSCFAITSFIIKVVKIPDFEIVENTKYICTNLIDQIVVFNMDNLEANYTLIWRDSSNTILDTIITNSSAAFSATIPGDYTVTAISTDGNNCTTTKIVHLLPAAPATNIQFTMNEFWEKENFSLEINVDGIGIYQYAIDNSNGPYQESPFITNIKPGIHTIFVKEMNACGVTYKTLDLFGFTPFFTPNGDGINDVWKVQGINFKTTEKIHIFDRYGKLMYMFYPAKNQGWDGNYFNQPALESEYWFTAEMTNHKGEPYIRKGHFSLLRSNN